jgi:heavy metal efflux system protein
VRKLRLRVTCHPKPATLPPAVKLGPYYDRAALVSVTTHTVVHNLFFGCLLVFIIQWVFLGNLRSAVIVSVVNIPFALSSPSSSWS